LLGHILGCDRSYLYAYPEQELTEEQEVRWGNLLRRRTQGEPVAYLVGEKAFYGLDFGVDKRVLIPRPETELLVERALRVIGERLANGQVPVVADIGTGSGAIPISVAVHEPRLPLVYAVDVSADALEVARANCLRHGVQSRVQLLQGDLLEPLPESVDVLLANLPYVGENEQPEMQIDVIEYEPHLALFSGPEGLDLLRRLLAEVCADGKLRPGATLLLEIGYKQGDRLTQEAREIWPGARVNILKDYAGWDRVVQIQL
jgi:release factor glutamine methyltransferase